MKNFGQKLLARQEQERSERRKKWEKRRTRGIWRFILPTALLSGLSHSILTLLIRYFYFKDLTDWREVPYRLIGSLLIGALFGAAIWWFSENEYKYLQNDKHQ